MRYINASSAWCGALSLRVGDVSRPGGGLFICADDRLALSEASDYCACPVSQCACPFQKGSHPQCAGDVSAPGEGPVTKWDAWSLEHCLPNVAVAAVPVVRAVCCSLMAEGPSLPHALVACLHLVGPGTWSAPSSWPHFTNGVFLQRLVTCLHQASFRKQVADNPITPGLRLLSPASVRHALQMLVALCGLLRVA